MAYNVGIGSLTIGILGIIFGIVIIWVASMLRGTTMGHVTYGVVIVIFAILALVLTDGSFVIGSILAIVGGFWEILI